MSLTPERRDNLLVVSRDEMAALGIFQMAVMSILYEGLHQNRDWSGIAVYILDLFAGDLKNGECGFEDMQAQFPDLVETVKLQDSEGLIESLYQTLLRREEMGTPLDHPVFFLFFGLNRARRLRASEIYDNAGSSGPEPLEMLERILDEGPQWGISTIVWSESVHGVEYMLGDRYELLFMKRIAYGLDEKSMDQLVMEENEVQGKTAVYMNVGRDIKNTHFRPYDVPALVWIEEYAAAVQARITEGG